MLMRNVTVSPCEEAVSQSLFHLTYCGHPALTRLGLSVVFFTQKNTPNIECDGETVIESA